MTYLTKWTGDMLGAMLKRFWTTLVALLEQHPVRLAVFVLLISCAVLSGNLYVKRTGLYQGIVDNKTFAEGDYKMLEAFIMSTLPDNLSKTLGETTLSGELTQQLDKVHASLLEAAASSEWRDDDLSVRLSLPDYQTAKARLKPVTGILTDESLGYLFLPLSFLREPVDQPTFDAMRNESERGRNSATLGEVVRRDPIVANDIRLSRRLAPLLQDFGVTHLFDARPPLSDLGFSLRPMQTYYITKTGVARFFDRMDPREQKVVLRNTYRSTTFFPSRPYFVEATRRVDAGSLSGISGAAQQKFYVSRPYMDLGGSGIVVTLARPVSYPGLTDGVLCFDLAVLVDEPIYMRLRQRLEQFEAISEEITCTSSFRGHVECKGSSQRASNRTVSGELEEKLDDSLKTGGISEMGEVELLTKSLERTAPEPLVLALLDFIAARIFERTPSPITFAIPVGTPTAPNDSSLRMRLFVSTLNLERYQQRTSVLGLIAVLCLSVAVFIIVFSWHGETRKRRNYEEAFRAIESVLYGASTPYCRLSAEDMIVDCNLAMCKMLGRTEDASSIRELKTRTLESLLEFQSKATYNVVKMKRNAGDRVLPYQLTFVRLDGKGLVEAEVIASEMPKLSSREFPQTFGIIVPSRAISMSMVPVQSEARADETFRLDPKRSSSGG